MNSSDDNLMLAIDYGERRIGVAKSDPSGTIAGALTTLEPKSWREAISRLAELIAEHRPAAIVVGYPLKASGERSAKCDDVDRFVKRLKAVYDGPIHLIDEAHTSEEAAAVLHAHGQKTGRDKKRIDRLAATIILQRYLDDQAQ